MDLQEVNLTLKETGLTAEEVQIYLITLKQGASLASKIAYETKINRSHVYQLLERLIEKGFMSYVVRENRKYFSAVHPEKLLEMAKEKEEKIRSALPFLMSMAVPTKNKPIVEIFEGKEGIKTILNDILKVSKEWLAFGSSGKGTEILPFFAEHWEEKREKKCVHLRGIMDASNSGVNRGKELQNRKYTEIRYIQEAYTYPSSTWIYGNRIALVVWDKQHSFAMRVISEAIAENYKKHFEILWKNAKQ